jgi:hypothetical protein
MIAAIPRSRIGKPPRRTRAKPAMEARTSTAIAAASTSRSAIRPLCVTRVGPRRSAVSAPRRKSKTSLAKFAPICKRSATKMAAMAGPGANAPSRIASAVPTITGARAAGRVRGRAARSQARAGEIVAAVKGPPE